MRPNVVLLAGGVGSRLWPLSNNSCPKQFIKLPSLNLSSFQITLNRTLNLATNILIISNIQYRNLLHQQIRELGLSPSQFHIILEKHSNNTGIAAYYGCLFFLGLQNYNLTYFMPTDQLLYEQKNFFYNILKKIDKNKINIFGQNVKNLNSNFGYIIAGEQLGYDYYKVKHFIEKPSAQKITELNDLSRNIYQNLGIYLASPYILYNQFNELYHDLPKIKFSLYKMEHYIEEEYSALPIDKMIAERSKIMNIQEITFKWHDIGSFDGLYKSLKGNSWFNYAISSKHIEQFNNENKEFAFCSSNGQIQLLRKAYT